ncbi:hypothetical protein [Hymenobacter volaticus]|uniref:MlaB-like STAS domain-containing protein n=1 Tax=Hymenobacter volaticus TaxID=2932254 RepID=A0ABY4G865_9BACT|nr:hypothetical protein [Hymenobacter volaticus]UOQ67103.1 hypothetical protein MUN86_04130 [Hymenobacter volaticus]
MAHFTAYSKQTQGNIGVSLRGQCADAAAALQLEAAIKAATTNGKAIVWIDCQRLEPMTWQGQRAILNADCFARTTGVVLQWCGMPEAVLEQLAASGLSMLLHLQPAAHYQGPRELLQDTLPLSTNPKFPQMYECASADSG